MIPIKKLFSPRRPAHAYACIRARPPERSQGQYGAMLAPSISKSPDSRCDSGAKTLNWCTYGSFEVTDRRTR